MADKPKQYMFVSNRTINVGSLTGRSILFEKGIPTHVPREMHAEVMEKGILPVDDKGQTLAIDKVEDPKPAPQVQLAPEDQGEREDAIRKALAAIAERNDAKDFNAGGAPTAKAVTLAVGWRVEAKEITPLWAEYKVAHNAQA